MGGASQLVTCQSALDLDGIDLSNQNVGCKQVLIHVENKQHAGIVKWLCNYEET